MGQAANPRRNRVQTRAIFLTAALMLCLLAVGAALIRRRRPVDPSVEGGAAYRRGDYAASSRIARAWLQAKNRDPDALRLLARSSLRQGDEARAESIYKSLGDDALGGEDFYLLGLGQHRRGDRAGAVDSWQRGASKDPAHSEMLAILARTLGDLDRFTPAMLVVRQLMSQAGETPRANLILGELYDMMSAPEQAAIALERGLSEIGDRIEPAEIARERRLLARCLLRTGRPAQARQALARLESIKPEDDAETRWLLSRCDLQEGKTPSASTAKLALAYREEFPLAPEPAPYAGAAQCAKCHRSNFESQRRSRHGRTFFTARQAADLPFLPQAAVTDPGSSRVVHSYHKVDGRLEVQTRIEDRLVRTIVDYAFGSGDRGLTLVGHDEKNHLFESRLSFYSGHGGWDVTSGQSAHPNDAVSYQGSLLNLDVVRRCILCHHTNPMSVLTQSGPEVSDPAIGCEKCHGPGGDHLRVVESSPPPFDLAIARPSLARGEPILRLCGQCHDPRNSETQVSPLQETAIRFQPLSLTWSRCYIESGQQLDCVTCHNPHRDAETAPGFYERRCLECHADAVARSARSGKTLGSPGDAPIAAKECPINRESGCITCHMPKDRISIPHSDFTDHFIRVRRDLAEPSQTRHESPR